MNINYVIIGINSETTIERAIKSINLVKGDNIVYVDGGSRDRSIELAKELGVEVISYNGPFPSPGLQRNLGWRSRASKYTMFLDSDTVLDREFVDRALEAFERDNKIGAVLGLRREQYPNKNTYHKITDLEWNGQSGYREEFGGDVLIKTSVLELVNGYNEVLVGGEDPELARRIRKADYNIFALDIPMTIHNIAMNTFKQYFKRAFRTGYAYGAVNHIHREYWKVEVRRIFIRAGGFFVFLILSIFYRPVFFILSFLLLFKPRLFLVSYFRERFSINVEKARLYALHASIVVIPEFFGLIRFYLGYAMKKPLRNKRR